MKLYSVQFAVFVNEFGFFREQKKCILFDRREVGVDIIPELEINIRILQNAFCEKWFGDQSSCRAYQVQLADQVQGMLLPFGRGQRGGVHAVLRLDFTSNHSLDVEQQQDGEDDKDDRDDRQDKHLAVFAAFAMPCSCKFLIHASLLMGIQKCRRVIRELGIACNINGIPSGEPVMQRDIQGIVDEFEMKAHSVNMRG